MNDKAKARRVIARILRQVYRIDLHQLRVIPEGAKDPLPQLPNQVEISDHDVDRAINRWDELMPEYKGLLNAAVTKRRKDGK